MRYEVMTGTEGNKMLHLVKAETPEPSTVTVSFEAVRREVVDSARAHTDLEMIRAIYDHVVATVKYDETGKGWGPGDICYACDARRGNCTDFHAIVIG